MITKNGTLKSKDLIKKIFENNKIKNKKLIFTCGSGISACVLSLSLMHVLDIKGSVYDGSWAEWGSKKQLTYYKMKFFNAGNITILIAILLISYSFFKLFYSLIILNDFF